MPTALINSNQHYVIYSMGCYILFSSYFVVDKLLLQKSKKYQDLTEDKRVYVVSNLLKGILLGGISPLASMILYQTMYLDQWNNNLIRNVGILYAVPDTVSLMLVNKMQRTTKIHHMIVTLFNIISIHNDYGQESIVRCMVIYACFSCFAFIVNLLLGARYLHDNKQIGIFMAKASLYIYVLCCLINWAWHGKYIHTLIDECNDRVCQITIPAYCGMIMMLAWDDLKLNKWLYKESYTKRRMLKSE